VHDRLQKMRGRLQQAQARRLTAMFQSSASSSSGGSARKGPLASVILRRFE
jgi:hypothetical protein